MTVKKYNKMRLSTKYKHKQKHKHKYKGKISFKIRRSKKINNQTKKLDVGVVKSKIIGDCKGGAPFIKGGYGCIFRPALKCVGAKSTPNYVSKLIETKYAKREYDYVMEIKKKLSSLGSDIRKYLLLDNVTICDPAPLTGDDMKNMENVCGDILSDLKDKSTNVPLDSSNINNNLDKFKIINMPELGISIHDFIKQGKLTPEDLIKINNIIIDYVLKIIPNINKHGVVHGDIKSSNILFSKIDKNIPILIDWGLSYTSNKDGTIPEDLFTLHVQWQHPFSTFLFSKDIIDQYEIFLKNMKKDNIPFTRNSLRVFAISHYLNYKKVNEKQHKILRDIFIKAHEGDFLKHLKGEQLFVDDAITEQMYMYYVINYIIDVLMSYTDLSKDKLNLDKYFSTVYIYNVDIWGIMSIYYEFIINSPTSYALSSNDYKLFINKIMHILIEHIFVNGSQRINTEKLANSIRNVNRYLEGINKGGHIKERNIEFNNKMKNNVLFYKKVEDSIGLRKKQIDVREIGMDIPEVKTGGKRKSKTHKINVIKLSCRAMSTRKRKSMHKK
jgi:serine/threonine protein kinase